MKVVILMSTYNGKKYMEQQIDSILSQKFHEFNLIIRDDGSTDEDFLTYLKILESKDTRITVFLEQNIGPKNSFFNLLKRYKNEYDYFAFADQDDFWHVDKLESAVKSLESYTDSPSLYFSNVEISDECLQPLGKISKIKYKQDIRNVLCQNHTAGCTMVFNKKLAQLASNTEKLNDIYMHDWWVLALATISGIVVVDEIARVKYRQHSSNTLGGTTNLFAKFIKRYQRMKTNKNATPYISKQASILLQDYNKILKQKDTEILFELVNSKADIWKRIKYCFSTNAIKRDSSFDNLIFKLIILTNKY